MTAAGRWEDMAAQITDEMLETFATIGTHEQIVDKVKARAGSYATQIGLTLPVEKPGDEERLKQKIREFQAI